jgi:hypothetical protein
VRARVLAALAVAFAAVGPAAPSVSAATPEFGRPTIEGSFGSEIVATQPVTFDAAPDLVEVLVTTADGSPLVAEAGSPGAGSTTLRYSVGGGDGHILPNTPVSVRWRVTADGVTTLSPVARTVVDDER